MITDFAYVAALHPPVGDKYIGTEHFIAGFAHSDEAESYLERFGIKGEELYGAALKEKITTESAVPSYRQTLKYREVFSLATTLAYQEHSAPDFKVSPRHLLDAIRRTPSSGAYRVLSELATKPGF